MWRQEMTNSERLQHLLNIDDPTNEEENKEFKKLFDSIVHDLDKYEELQRILLNLNKTLWGE